MIKLNIGRLSRAPKWQKTIKMDKEFKEMLSTIKVLCKGSEMYIDQLIDQLKNFELLLVSSSNKSLCL
jgi:hypothetical protein